MQPVQRHSGKAKQIEETSIDILTSGRPLTVWPEGTVTRDPKKWVMSIKEGVGYIALESSRRLGHQVPLYPAVTWGAASINHWWPWPRKNVVMCYDHAARLLRSACRHATHGVKSRLPRLAERADVARASNA